ncbi:MAG TPA: hypothetical protein VJX10_04550 [Pseudonocardiaceae bacterium]|nr:hypothetical protein [Pseudonocardiaceae bacterium]
MTATLHLPPGISAVGPGTAAPLVPHSIQAHPISDVHPIGATAAGGQGSTTNVTCPAGTGTVVCASPNGLAPGDTVVLDFRVDASPDATDGTITGTVMAGQRMGLRVAVAVRVHVAPPPEVDGLALSAHLDEWDSWFNWLWDGSPVLDVTATNTGTSTKPVTVSVDRPGVAWLASPPATCTGSKSGVTCVTDEPLAPHQSFRLRLRVFHLEPKGDTVDVAGTLGTAHATAHATIQAPRCDWLLCVRIDVHHRGGPSPTPTPSPTTTTPAPTTTPPTTTTIPVLPTVPPTIPPTTTTPERTTTAPPSTTTTPPTTKQPPPGCVSTPPKPGQVRPGTECLPVVPQLFGLIGSL